MCVFFVFFLQVIDITNISQKRIVVTVGKIHSVLKNSLETSYIHNLQFGKSGQVTFFYHTIKN